MTELWLHDQFEEGTLNRKITFFLQVDTYKGDWRDWPLLLWFDIDNMLRYTGYNMQNDQLEIEWTKKYLLLLD